MGGQRGRFPPTPRKRGVGGKGPGGTCSKVLGVIDGDAPCASLMLLSLITLQA